MREYEILVAGPIGPVAASSLPGFTTVTVPTVTLLTGTVANPDDIRAVLQVLRARGLAATDVRIEPRHQPVTKPPRRTVPTQGVATEAAGNPPTSSPSPADHAAQAGQPPDSGAITAAEFDPLNAKALT